MLEEILETVRSKFLEKHYDNTRKTLEKPRGNLKVIFWRYFENVADKSLENLKESKKNQKKF